VLQAYKLFKKKQYPRKVNMLLLKEGESTSRNSKSTSSKLGMWLSGKALAWHT
jgi:hypothetical protein